METTSFLPMSRLTSLDGLLAAIPDIDVATDHARIDGGEIADRCPGMLPARQFGGPHRARSALSIASTIVFMTL